MSAGAAGRELLDAIGGRDFARVEACFAIDVSFRVLTPGPLRELGSAPEVARRYRAWLEPLGDFELLEGDVEEIADRVRVRYRFRGRDPEKGWQLNEHTAYGTVVDGRIVALNVTCTGFRPAPAP